MGTARPTNDTTKTPRKRAPRKAAESVAQPETTPAPVEETAIDPAPEPEYGRDFEPIPGISLDTLRGIVEDAQENPDTAAVVIDGIRSLITSNGHDPDAILDAARKTPAGPQQHDGLTNAFVEFRGRRIEVTAPQIEQVMVIRRMQSLFANAAKMQEITADEAIRLMDRALSAVCSVVVHAADVRFLEDLLLSRQAKIEELLPLLRESMQALERVNANNRSERRKVAKSSAQAGRAALVTTE